MARSPCPGLPRPENERDGSRAVYRLFWRFRRRSLHSPDPRSRAHYRGQEASRRNRAAIRGTLAQGRELYGPPDRRTLLFLHYHRKLDVEGTEMEARVKY